MQWFCWHVPVKMSLGFLCLFLVCNTAQQRKLFLSLFLHFAASCIRRENKKEKQVAVLAMTELPAKSVDLSAINLTELVNSMLNTALRGTKKLFSLLSVTSYSSFAFHKVSVTIYNISNVKNVDPGKFPMHCYCLNNVTNDLTDFTALLVDIIGNSTSYLTEIFKSTSILSVRQSNDSDCIYICVMTGQTGRNLSDFWEMMEKSPVVNYTFSSNTSDLDSIISSFTKLQEDPNKMVDPSAEHVWTFKTTRVPLAQKGKENPTTWFPPWPKTPHSPALVSMLGRTNPHFTSLVVGQRHYSKNHKSGCQLIKYTSVHIRACRKGLFTAARTGPLSTRDSNVVISNRQEKSSAQGAVILAFSGLERDGQRESHNLFINHLCFVNKAKKRESSRSLFFSSGVFNLGCRFRCSESYFFVGCPQVILKESRVTSPPVTLIMQKISPCVMELCRFFQLCLCVGQRRHSRKETMRYCIEYYSWFLKNASYVCERVKRVAYSHTLKQKCLKNICTAI
ncbi:HHLA1 protein, partial [Caloenas nicobarica]|nr:HHLA1 protein [Caloenas nicobarica]